MKPLAGIALLMLLAVAIGLVWGVLGATFFPGFIDTLANALLMGVVVGAVCAAILVRLLRKGGS